MQDLPTAPTFGNGWLGARRPAARESIAMDTRLGQIAVTYSARGIPSYSLELWHDGLKKHRLIRDGDRQVVQRKADLQAAQWAQSVRGQRDEISSLLSYSTMRSARRTTDCGIGMPSSRATFRFTVSSNLVGRSMGRSPGRAPFRMRSTCVAARRSRSLRSAP